MTVSIVHWRDLVRPDFMTDFVRIAKAFYYARREDHPKVLAKVPDEIKKEYIQTRESMRCCGFEVQENIVRWHGWYTGYVEEGELRFKTTAPPEREYISLKKFQEFKRAEEEKERKAREEDERWPEIKEKLLNKLRADASRTDRVEA